MSKSNPHVYSILSLERKRHFQVFSVQDEASPGSSLTATLPNLPDLDSLSAGLTCIAFCICWKKKPLVLMWQNYPIYTKSLFARTDIIIIRNSEAFSKNPNLVRFQG